MHTAATAVQRPGTEELHRRLTAYNRSRLSPCAPGVPWRDGLSEEIEHRLLEDQLVEDERRGIRDAVREIPRDPDAFLAWFERLEVNGPGQGDPLFPWLADSAPRAALRWFLEQEAAGEAGFDDLVALTQVKLPARAKLELARNYWDEMGRGDERGMHGPMLARLTSALELDTSADRIVWESLALGNLMLAEPAYFGVERIAAIGMIARKGKG